MTIKILLIFQSITRPMDVTLTGEDSVNEMEGALFKVEAYITQPKDTLKFEVLTPNNIPVSIPYTILL